MADQRVRDFGLQSTYDGNAYLWLDKAGWTEARKILASTLVAGGGGGGTPGGADTQVQFNESGTFGGDAELVWDTVGKALTLSATGTATLVVKQVGGGDEVFEVDTTNKRTKLNDADGTITIVGPGAIGSAFHILNDTSGSDMATAAFSSIDTGGVGLGCSLFTTSARGSLGSPSIVQDDDSLFALSITGYDSAGYAFAAGINVFVDGAPGANDMPARMVFSTTANGSPVPTSRIIIFESGDVVIGDATATSGSGELSVVQDDASGAQPALYLRQDDIDVEFSHIEGTSDAGSADRSLVDAGDFTTPGGIAAWEMVYVTDTRGAGITAGKYYRPLFTIPTA